MSQALEECKKSFDPSIPGNKSPIYMINDVYDNDNYDSNKSYAIITISFDTNKNRPPITNKNACKIESDTKFNKDDIDVYGLGGQGSDYLSR